MDIRIINETKNGRVFTCPDCDKIHIEFNNLVFNFNEQEYKHFCNYVKALNGQFWEYLNINTHYKRKFFIPLGHKNFTLLFSNSELSELKELFNKNRTRKQRVVNMSNYFVSDN